MDREDLERLLTGTIMRMGPGPWLTFLTGLGRIEKARLDQILRRREEGAAVRGNQRELLLLSRRRQVLRQVREQDWKEKAHER